MEGVSSQTVLCFKATGNSMWPIMKKGDWVTVIKPDKIREGDIITWFTRYNKVITHRVYWLDQHQRHFITKGDLAMAPEKVASAERILGKVIYVKKRRFAVNVNGDLSARWYELYFRIDKFLLRRLHRVPNRIQPVILLCRIFYLLIFIIAFILSVYESRDHKIL